MQDDSATSARGNRRGLAGRPLTFGGYLALRRFPALDGVRAVAAVAVVLFHFGGPSFTWASGWLGVHVFFVLSGFLITTLALREEDRRGAVSLRDFYVRRAFRIWPAYFAVLLVLVVLFHLRGEFGYRRMAEALPWYATFNGDIWLGDTLFGHTWTIGIEQKFYLVWPLLAFVPWVRGTRRRLVLMTVVFLGGAIAWVPTSGYVVHYLVIAVGCLVAVLMHHRRGYGIVAHLARPVPALACWTALLGYQLMVPTLVRAAGSEPPVVLGYGVLVGCVLPSLVALPVTGRLLGGRVLRWWGERSYSLYLVQLLAAWALMALTPVLATPRLLSGAAVVVVSALMADLLYRYVEVPCIAAGKRLTDRRRSSPRHGVAARAGDTVPGDRTGTLRIPVPGPRVIGPAPGAPALLGPVRHRTPASQPVSRPLSQPASR